MRLQEMNKQATSKKLNKVVESRFGYAINFDKLTFKKAYRIAQGLTESIDSIKRTYGAKAVEKNSTYMEMIMVRESLHRWMAENRTRFLMESELAKSEAILASKDIVDSIQDMLETISKMQSEQMPALIDSIRDQISSEQAEAYKGAITPILTELMTQLTTARESADTASRTLAGEQPAAAPMDMGMGGAPGGDLGAGGLPGQLPPEQSDLDMGDEFGATDAAAGGTEELGRERR